MPCTQWAAGALTHQAGTRAPPALGPRPGPAWWALPCGGCSAATGLYPTLFTFPRCWTVLWKFSLPVRSPGFGPVTAAGTSPGTGHGLAAPPHGITECQDTGAHPAEPVIGQPMPRKQCLPAPGWCLGWALTRGALPKGVHVPGASRHLSTDRAWSQHSANRKPQSGLQQKKQLYSEQHSSALRSSAVKMALPWDGPAPPPRRFSSAGRPGLQVPPSGQCALQSQGSGACGQSPRS